MDAILKPIIILASPRVGSNMLMHSLATHPDSICGGEWYREESRSHPEYFRNRQEKRCNLIKLCMSDEVPFDGLLVGLFREDIDAQLNSWEKACTTGEWMHGAKLSPTPFPENARQLIIETNYRIDGICDLVFSYETLVSQWSDLVAVILQSAGWRVLPICMATIKQAAASRSNPWRLDAGER